MEDQKGEVQEEQNQPVKAKGGSKKLLIIIVCAVLVLGGGIGYFVFSKSKKPDETKEKTEEKKSVLVALDPFILNLAEQGRFLKISIQLELSEPSIEEQLKNKLPQLRDVIIMLVSNKSVESISSAEGKFQLKDEILLRSNQVMGKDVIRNIYFTEFVMQ